MVLLLLSHFFRWSLHRGYWLPIAPLSDLLWLLMYLCLLNYIKICFTQKGDQVLHKAPLLHLWDQRNLSRMLFPSTVGILFSSPSVSLTIEVGVAQPVWLVYICVSPAQPPMLRLMANAI